MRNNKTIMIYPLFITFLSFFCKFSNADNVIVESSQVDLQKYFNGCSDIQSGCSVDLDLVLKTINSTQFQKQLDSNQSQQFKISFLPQIYRLKDAINLNWNSNTKLILQGNVKNKTTISGALSGNLEPLSINDPNFSRIPLNISKNIYTVNFPVFDHGQVTGFKHPSVPTAGELFWNNQVATLARWPNQDFTKISSVDMQSNTFILNNFVQKTPDSQLQAHGFWRWDWADHTYPIQQNTGKLSNFKILANTSIDYGIKSNQRVYLENALELIDSPNEWYQDYKTGTIYFWLPNKNNKIVEFSNLKNLLLVNNSKNIEINNMIFEKTRADAIIINNSQFINLNNIVVNFTGNAAIKINDGSNNMLDHSQIVNTGEGGIYINSGDRPNLIAANNIIQNSYFSNNDRLVYSYRPAINLLGVGQIVKNNTIENSGHSAIIYQGNNHIILNNKIFNVLKITSDAGAIYTGRDFTSRGTIIKNNTISDIFPFRFGGSVVGVYLDDQASGITVESNKFTRVQYGIQIGGGRNNSIQNNIFKNNHISIRYDARGTTWQKAITHEPNGIIMRNLKSMPIQSLIWKKEYPDLANILNDDFGQPKYNVIEGNKFIQSGAIRFESGLSDNSSDKGATISSNTQIQ
ncbi:right-handed parallel beta-helix repeat-containing protein [Acinetobacter soli]|uniref:right-handed parallel beta-helix repeat-containing protein n=1 Tax=Acinetobacter soli TaxID=487316 RepID=UPI001ABD3BDE|nr:right-handed parallel beta-helix repeat-containing protein [Acinetobacter soli]MBO3672645.1 right-handed parallel beta-helix repeat-containing protein [Acinetobacter soli]